MFRNSMIWLAAGAAAMAMGAHAFATTAKETRITEVSNRDKTGTSPSPQKTSGPQMLEFSTFASRQISKAEGMGPYKALDPTSVLSTTCSLNCLPVGNLRLFASDRALSRALRIDHGD